MNPVNQEDPQQLASLEQVSASDPIHVDGDDDSQLEARMIDRTTMKHQLLYQYLKTAETWHGEGNRMEHE